MSDFAQRVMDEHKELNDKIGKLTAFMETTTFLGLPKEDRDLLAAQREHMIQYNGVLVQRLARLR